MLVQVHRRDLYKQKHPPNARTGPADGPVRTLDVSEHYWLQIPVKSEQLYGIVVVLIGFFLRSDINDRAYLPMLYRQGYVIQFLSKNQIDIFPGGCFPLKPTIVKRLSSPVFRLAEINTEKLRET